MHAAAAGQPLFTSPGFGDASGQIDTVRWAAASGEESDTGCRISTRDVAIEHTEIGGERAVMARVRTSKTYRGDGNRT
ncbi:hypothetical protein SAY87_016741 [Trapa incisa]|uniref:Uncharacterized protein n=1 Tax=Trapa incisa TaxID=236973 RepID=A0AAN7QYB5_9MYRT|nr:hypothetical protein SAY87_016741 [Trapa incisa]